MCPYVEVPDRRFHFGGSDQLKRPVEGRNLSAWQQGNVSIRVHDPCLRMASGTDEEQSIFVSGFRVLSG